MLRDLQTGRKLVTTLCLLSLALLAILLTWRGSLAQASPGLLASLSRAPHAHAHGSAAVDWRRVREDADGFVAVAHDGGRIELTIDPQLQHQVERVLDGYAAPAQAAVVLSVDDGRVLAMAGRSAHESGNDVALALRPWAPAASIFKLVTASALVENGLQPDARVCYHDGVHSVEPSNLRAHPRWDSACNTLAFGVAKSQNAIIARLAHEHLDPLGLERLARGFGFGEALPFALPTEASAIAVPRSDALEFARTAAGFWHSTLSPLHGAYLAATLARGGVTPPLRIIDRVVSPTGEALRPAGAPERRVVSEETAQAVARMMVGTTQFGTARLGFHDRRGRPLLPVAVAGKTGSLNRPAQEGPFLAYSWFVGFAPAERPEVAIAVLVGNGEIWHKKAHQLAEEILSSYFHDEPAAPSVRMASR